jgi:hypothetical protein
MNWDIFYMGLYFGTIGDITEDMDEALKIVLKHFESFLMYNMPNDCIHIEAEQ